MPVITTSIFELLKIGPGPSSSHTIGPMKAGHGFHRLMAELPPELMERADTLRVHLYGSLSATGKGHGTDRAVLAGLLGKSPDDAPPTSWTPSPQPGRFAHHPAGGRGDHLPAIGHEL